MGVAVPRRIGRHVHPAAKTHGAKQSGLGTGHRDRLPRPGPDRHTAALMARRVDHAELAGSTTAEEPDSGSQAEFASSPEPVGEVAGVIADLAAIAEADPADPDRPDMLIFLEDLENS